MYDPETKWQVCDDLRLVYNTKGIMTRRGSFQENDVAVFIEARHLPVDVQQEIAAVICNALNERFPVKEEKE